jgi:hypothetical protein
MIHLIAENAGIDLRVTPDVDAIKEPVNVDFRDAPFDKVFRLLIKANHLSYAIINEKTVVVTTTP